MARRSANARRALVAEVFGRGNEPDPIFMRYLTAFEAEIRSDMVDKAVVALEASPVNWAGVLGAEAAVEIVRALSTRTDGGEA